MLCFNRWAGWRLLGYKTKTQNLQSGIELNARKVHGRTLPQTDQADPDMLTHTHHTPHRSEGPSLHPREVQVFFLSIYFYFIHLSILYTST